MDQGEKKILEDVLLADAVLETILSQLKIDQSDELHRALVKNMIRRQAKDQLVLAIWGGLSDEQSVNLREFMRASRITAEWLSEENIVIEFALQYPDLKERMFDALSEFFKGFIERFNEGKG